MRILSRATNADLPQLRDLSISAFVDDDKYKPSDVISGGAPGLDTIEKHRIWLCTMDYYKCIQDGELVGSCILNVHGARGVIHGILVKEIYINKGFGTWILTEAIGLYPQVRVWELETPDYATRNHRFYKKNGFSLAEITPKESALGFGFHKYRKETLMQRST